MPLYGYRSTTWRKEEAERGLEADECYTRGPSAELPQIALEVVVSNPLLNELDVYAGIGIQEVWVFKIEDAVFTLYTLRGDVYETIARSEILPEAPLPRIAHDALLEEQHEALKAFRAEARSHP